MKRVVAVGLILMVVVVGALIVRRPPAVQRVALEQRDVVSMLAVVGRVRAPTRAGLGASVTGAVTAVLVKEGDRVDRGDLLVSLEDSEARAAVRQAEAALAEVRASTRQLIEDAEREAAQSQRDFERIQTVFREGALTRQQVEQAQIRAADAAARLASLRAIASPQGSEPATVTRAVANLETARARLDLTRVRAPAAGTILTRSVEPGDAASPGRVLVEWAGVGPVELVVFPGEENLASLTLGGAATASADAFPDRVFEATVAMIAPSVDPTQGTIEVRLTVPEPPDFLLPDMTVSVNLETGRKNGATVLPETAVQGLGTDQPWVGVVREGRLERQPVQVGLRAGEYVEILEGARDDDVLVSSPTATSIGSRVRLTEPAGA
jgi:HlyD family secretion protein